MNEPQAGRGTKRARACFLGEYRLGDERYQRDGWIGMAGIIKEPGITF